MIKFFVPLIIVIIIAVVLILIFANDDDDDRDKRDNEPFELDEEYLNMATTVMITSAS